MTDSVPPPASQPEPTPAATPAPAPAPPAPAPAAAAAPAPATGEKWNVLSIVAFVIVFLGFSLISIILGLAVEQVLQDLVGTRLRIAVTDVSVPHPKVEEIFPPPPVPDVFRSAFEGGLEDAPEQPEDGDDKKP